MRFQHHPDGWITMNDFSYSLEEFLTDEPTYQLPNGVIGREYMPGERHVTFTNNTAFPQPLTWPEGNQYIANVEKYRTAYNQRQADAEAAAIAEAEARLTYLDKRRAGYPRVAEQLEALWAGGEQAKAMKAVIQAIDARYPAPNA